MSSASLSRYALSLGARDATHGWCARIYSTAYNIIGSIQPKGNVMGNLLIGNYASYPQTLFTPDAIHIGDHVKDAQGSYYEVRAADQWWRLNQFSHYVCNLEKISPYDPTRPDTSATWHVDSDGTKTDPRERTITWLNLYDNPASIGGTYAYMFGGADYPFQLEFIDNALDALYVVEAPDSTPEYTSDHYPYKFNESVNIHIYAINRTAISAPVILEQMEQQIRDIATDYPTYHTSLRAITSVKSEPILLGGLKLWHSIVSLKYSRENDDYIATKPTLTYSTISGGPYTFIFPNVTKITLPNINNDLFMQIPGRLGNIPQSLGSESIEIQLTCDLDIEHTNLTWMRPQTTTPKTDVCNFQIFLDIMHSAAQTEPYLILTLDWGSFNVRLTRMEPSFNGENNNITLTFKEYNDTEANTSYKTRWGIT